MEDFLADIVIQQWDPTTPRGNDQKQQDLDRFVHANFKLL
jgi:hypothetical protein